MTFDAGRIRHAADLMHYAKASNGSSAPSNWRLSSTGDTGVVWTPEGAASTSYGSNSNEVSYANAGGASALASRADHVHRGVTSISHASNTYTGPVTLETEGSLYIVRSAANTYRLGSAAASGGGGVGSAWVSSERAFVDPTTQTWAWLNQGSATINSNGASLTLLDPNNTGDSWRMRTKAVPSKPYSVIVHMEAILMPVNYPGFAVGWVQSSNGFFAGFGQYSVSGSGLNFNSFKSTTNYSITVNYLNTTGNLQLIKWVKLTDDVTNRRIYLSADGFSWILWHTIATNTDITPDKLMFGCESRNASSFDMAVTVNSWEEGA